MKRSKKELSALKSAFEICSLARENSANVIAGSTSDEFTETDISWFNMAEEFIVWYENMLERLSSNPNI